MNLQARDILEFFFSAESMRRTVALASRILLNRAVHACCHPAVLLVSLQAVAAWSFTICLDR